MNILTESIQKYEFGGMRYRIWRHEPTHQTADDFDFKSFIGKHTFNFSPRRIAEKLLEIERVNAVEFTDLSGKGQVLYKDWP